jgi:putative transposase
VSSRYEFIDAEEGNYPMTKMFGWAGVSSSGFYEWRNRPASATAQRRERLKTIITEVFDDSDGTYGYRRVHAVLARSEIAAGPELVRALMRELGLVPCQPRPWRPTTTIAGDAGEVPDLVRRDFTASAPGTKLVGDITYIRTWAGWLYLLVTWNQRAGWIITDRHHDHELRGPVTRERRGEVAGPGSARTSRRVAHDLDQSGPCAPHHRRLRARAGGVPAGL